MKGVYTQYLLLKTQDDCFDYFFPFHFEYSSVFQKGNILILFYNNWFYDSKYFLNIFFKTLIQFYKQPQTSLFETYNFSLISDEKMIQFQLLRMNIEQCEQILLNKKHVRSTRMLKYYKDWKPNILIESHDKMNLMRRRLCWSILNSSEARGVATYSGVCNEPFMYVSKCLYWMYVFQVYCMYVYSKRHSISIIIHRLLRFTTSIFSYVDGKQFGMLWEKKNVILYL